MRLPRPWDSPGKNTGVGCHFLLQCMKMKVKSLSYVRLLATPWTAAHQAPPSMGFSRQECWSGVPAMQIPDHLTCLLRNPSSCQEATIRTFSSVQSLSHVRFFATPWTAARQASLSITNYRSLLKLMSIKSVMPSNHLILCRLLLLLHLIFPNIRIFSSESVLHIRWPGYWTFSLH